MRRRRRDGCVRVRMCVDANGSVSAREALKKSQSSKSISDGPEKTGGRGLVAHTAVTHFLSQPRAGGCARASNLSGRTVKSLYFSGGAELWRRAPVGRLFLLLFEGLLSMGMGVGPLSPPILRRRATVFAHPLPPTRRGQAPGGAAAGTRQTDGSHGELEPHARGPARPHMIDLQNRAPRSAAGRERRVWPESRVPYVDGWRRGCGARGGRAQKWC